MQEMNKINLEIYHDENGDFKIELVDFKSIKDDEFELILYHVCLFNDIESFLKIIKEEKFNIDIRFKNNEGISLLHLCAKSNSIEIFQILLEMGRYFILIQEKK
jgi:ankyrin repeat protein